MPWEIDKKMKAEKISLGNAKEDKLFYFVANVIIYRKSDGRCLVLKRSESEKVHPGKYCVPGGKLEWRDVDISRPTRMNGNVLDFEDAVKELLMREVKEEAGIEIQKELKYINSVVFVRPDGIPVVLIKFAAEYAGGEVRLEDGAFTDFAWVNEVEICALECIKGIPEEVAETINLFVDKNSSLG